MRDNLEDLGLDQYDSSQYQANSLVPVLYPVISMPKQLVLTDEDIFRIQKLREQTHRFATSPYHIRDPRHKEKDIVRYSDKYRIDNSGADTAGHLVEYINISKEDAVKFVPSELIDGEVLGGRLHKKSKIGSDDSSFLKSRKKRNEELALLKLEQQEQDGSKGKPDEMKEGEKKDGVLSDAEEDGLEDSEEDDDYGVDHYASDDGGFGGGSDGEEATFD